MARFNLVTIIEDTEEVAGDVEKVIADFHAALAKFGHKVTAATLTSDSGQTKLSIPEPVVVEPTTQPTAEVASPFAATPPTPIRSTLDDVKA